MNRLLVLPLIVSVLLFAAIFMHLSNQDSSEGDAVSGSVASLGRGTPQQDLMPFDEARHKILESWPQESPQELFSRREVGVSLTADLTPPADVTENRSSTNFLCALILDGMLLNPHSTDELEAAIARPLPIHVDRQSREIFIFFQSDWIEYGQWLKTYQPAIRERTGFGV
ncbi:hypothetical protein LOC67_08760 [Stieleria sp. JC731]|uniref:hypothetical protein n=1 Tax=Pirellulaceae TaxID=2691357 RepID=UPI001E3C6A41|nr:hypothetical protein [Stieleria sp. JC731]MCC9600651.1 hypothetical protein [Stieleria sp. JC731]